MIEKIKYLSKFPPKIIVKKIINLGNQKIKNIGLKKIVAHTDRRNKQVYSLPYSYLSIKDLNTQQLDTGIVKYLVDQYSQHRFNLLGSGWVKMDYSTNAPGLEDYHFQMNLDIPIFDRKGDWLTKVIAPAHLDISKKYWSEIIKTNPNYQPIDWQKDFKSGFRWDAQQWYKVQFGLMKGRPGIDLKVPWELSRFQHLPQLATFATLDGVDKDQCIREFKCQTLDFFATNPTGMGVNYQCAMDVGIRAANLCIAYDLFRQLDETGILDKTFQDIYAENLFLHGQHILEDLEYQEGFTSNHYLGNISGLLFIAAYLSETPIINQWLAFSIQELIHSMGRQFFADGGNFEASTSYHRLSGEMMVYSTAIILGLGKEKRSALETFSIKNWKEKAILLSPEQQLFKPKTLNILPNQFLAKLYRIGTFGLGIRKSNGEIPQFGDNDSGRFFRFSPNGHLMCSKKAVKLYLNLKNYSQQYLDEQFWDENDLNTDTFLAAINGLFNTSNFNQVSQLFPLETSITKGLSKQNSLIKIVKNASKTLPAKSTQQRVNLANFPFTKKITLGQDTTNQSTSYQEELTLSIFPEFQIYIFKSTRIYLAIGGISHPKQHRSGSHVHNDSLSIELSIDGKDLIVDPGTYLYTPIPKHRIEFRSTPVHNTLIVKEEEQNKAMNGFIGLFAVSQDTTINLIESTRNSITLRLTYRHIDQVRKITIADKEIQVEDYSNVPFKQHFNYFNLYSNGYGKKYN